MATIKAGDLVTVSSTWLDACGLLKMAGQAFKVTGVEDYGRRGIMYQVTRPDGAAWTVWSVRGVERFVSRFDYRVTYTPRIGDAPAHHFSTLALEAVTFAERCRVELARLGSEIILEARDGATWHPQLMVQA